MIEWAVQHFFNREWGKKGSEPTFFLGFFTVNSLLLMVALIWRESGTE